MSWTDVYPVMDEGMVDEFEELATSEEKAELEEWYGVAKEINRQDKPHLLAMSLFWKPSSESKTVYPAPTREILMNAGELGLDLRFEPWPHYVQPILDEVPTILAQHDDVAVRVYLAADLEFLIDDLVAAGCEVFLMRHPSIAHAPGVAWRVLAFGDKDRLVTMVDCDRLSQATIDIERTRAMERSGMNVWRVPVYGDFNAANKVGYKPMIGCQLGATGGWPMERLIHAFTWQVRRGAILPVIEMPGCGLVPAADCGWPDFGFEEWFLGVVMYPRMAGAGMITFVPAGAKSTLLLLDIEYATWSNPESQLVFFPVAGCCAPPTEGEGDMALAGELEEQGASLV